MARTSTLIVPGLAAAPVPVPRDDIPNLTAACAKARVQRGEVGGRHAAVWSALGGSGAPPGAAVASWFAVHGEAPDHPVLLATPVQMFAGPEQASMVPVADVGPEHQPALWIRLTQAVIEGGGRLIAGPEGLIWLKLEQEAEGGADPFLAAGDPVDLPGEPALLKLLNDLQMLLHDQPDAGFNSLWFWGGGALPAASSVGEGMSLVDGDAVTRGAALRAGAEVQDRWDGSSPVVRVYLGLAAAAGGDSDDWLEALAEWDREVLAPLLEAGGPIVIVDPRAGLSIEPARSWWRRLFGGGGTPAELIGWPQP